MSVRCATGIVSILILRFSRAPPIRKAGGTLLRSAQAVDSRDGVRFPIGEANGVSLGTPGAKETLGTKAHERAAVMTDLESPFRVNRYQANTRTLYASVL